MSKHSKMRAMAIIAAAMPVAQVVAATTEVPDTDTTAVALREIEVMANRATAKTPVAFTQIDRKQLDRANDGRDLPFMLSMTPSLIFTSDAGAGVGYSALRVRGTDASRINVTTNGVPVNDAESHRVYWVNMPDLASSLRDVQIQRGAGTSTNGAGAFGATINMLTDAPAHEAYGELTGAYGMYGTHRETLRVGSGLLGDHWTVDARISNIGSDGYIDRASSALWSYMGQVGWSNAGTTLRLLAFGGKEETYMAWDYASREEMEKYGRRYNPCGQYTDSEGNIAYYPDQKDNYIQHNFQLLFGQTIGENWRLNAALHYTRGLGYYRQYKTGRTLVEYGLQPFETEDGEVTKADIIRLKHDNNHFGGLTAALNYARGRVNATLGGAVNNYTADHFGQIDWVRNYVGALDPLQEYYRNDSRKFDANIYARANVDISRLFAAYADLQYRHINYKLSGRNDNYDYTTEAMQILDIHRRYNFFNPKVGVNFTDARGRNRAFVSWSVAHKEPARSCFTDGDRTHIPEPERMFDYEVGYTFSHPMFSVGANLYYMDYKDQLVLTGQLSDTGNPLSVNVPKSYRMGIELQGALKPCRWFDWQINATLSRNRIKDYTQYIYEDGWTNPIEVYIGSTPIAFSPSFTLNNAFNFAWRGFEASLQSHYVSKQYMTNDHSEEQALDAYFVSDLMLAYSFGRIASLRDLRVGVAINNIFNEEYESNGYAGAGYYVDDNGEKVVYRYAGYAAQAPINVQASVTIKF